MTPELNAAEREAVAKARAFLRGPGSRNGDALYEEMHDEHGRDLAPAAYGFAQGYLAATADARERAIHDAADAVERIDIDSMNTGYMSRDDVSRALDAARDRILALLRPASEKEAT